MCIGAALLQQIDHVFEKFHVAALIAGDGDALGVFLDGGVDDLLDRAVVAQMDHLDAGALQNAPENIDGGVVAVKKGRRRDDPHVVRGGKLQHRTCLPPVNATILICR
jgi:hypothetical protein